jgi:polysaccharide pyruvyl transferase WcaK-like protein
MATPTVALHGNHYDNNFGDLLLLKVFERWVAAAGDYRITYPWLPDEEAERFSRHFPGRATGKVAGSWQALIYCGGGLFADTGRDGRWLRGHFAKRFAKEVAPPARIARRKKLPYAIIGPGAGPITNLFTRREAARMFRGAARVSVRDEESRAFLLRELGVPDGFVVAPDPATTASREDVPTAARDAIAARLASAGGSVLLGVHHPRDFVAPSAPSAILLRALLQVLRNNPDVTPVLFTDIGSDTTSAHCEKLAATIATETGRSSLTIPFPGVWETVSLLHQLSAVLTTKLHIGIVSYAVGTYVEAFPYHPKVQQFYRVTDRASQCALLAEVTDSIAVAKIQRAIVQGRARPELRDARWAETRRRAEEHGRVVAEFLHSATGCPAR